MTPEELIQLIEKQKAALVAQDATYINRLVEAYQAIYARLQGDIDALLLAIEKAGTTSRGQIIRLSQYKRLMEDVERELVKYSAYIEMEIGAAARASMTMASADTQMLMKALLADVGIGADAIKILYPEAIEQLLGYLAPDGVLFSRLAQLGKVTAGRISETIITNVAIGKNPLTIASILTRDFGMALTDSMRMMRTVQLYSYREASRANYLANSNVVKGWVWYAELDGSTCGSCIAQHGSFHELSETLNDHHNGRCTMLPVTYTMDNPVDQNGEDWFKEQNEATQKSIMGEGKWQAWKDGKFEFSQLSTEHADDVYGQMRTEATLKDLVRDG